MAKIGNEDITMAHSHAASCALGTCTRAERVCRALTDPDQRQLVTASGSNKDGRSGGIFFDFSP